MLDALDQVGRQMQERRAKPLGQPFFSDPRYEAVAFDRSRFVPLEGNVRYLAAVDGGNQELIGGASVSLQLVRAYANVFGGKKRAHQEKHEFLCLTQAVDGERFESRIIPLKGGLLQEEGVLEMSASEVPDSDERTKAAQIGSLTRRFAEWALCERILEKFDDILVLKDGTLQTSVRREAFYARRAQERVRSGKFLASLSKTCTLLTSTGWSVTDAVEHMAPQSRGEWAYQWLAESKHPDHPARIGCAKLHKAARQSFRLESFLGHESLPLESLAENACDPAFLGYPYALVDADRNAKVTNAECGSFKGLAAAKLGRKLDEAARHTDAHAWLSKL
ncbi:hypothetical protein HYV43_04970 [Candidatus Micrarchaeota archaeon]|nr:hypothetical protein [Candidatus Micrarchaeota archaeon]